MRALLVKEIRSLFNSPMAYSLLGLFGLCSGFMFLQLIIRYVDNMQALPAQYTLEVSFVNEVILQYFGNMNFLFLVLIPIISMRSFAEEHKNQTINLLYLSKIDDFKLLMAKFLGLVTFSLSFIALVLLNVLVVLWVGVDDFALITSALMGLILSVLCYISMCLFASTLTSQVIIAALLGFVFILASWLVSWAATSSANYFYREIFQYLSINYHFENLARGYLGSESFIYYLSLIGFFLYLSTKSLAKRKW